MTMRGGGWCLVPGICFLGSVPPAHRLSRGCRRSRPNVADAVPWHPVKPAPEYDASCPLGEQPSISVSRQSLAPASGTGSLVVTTASVAETGTGCDADTGDEAGCGTGCEADERARRDGRKYVSACRFSPRARTSWW